MRISLNADHAWVITLGAVGCPENSVITKYNKLGYFLNSTFAIRLTASLIQFRLGAPSHNVYNQIEGAMPHAAVRSGKSIHGRF